MPSSAAEFVQALVRARNPLELLLNSPVTFEDQLEACHDDQTRAKVLKAHAFLAFRTSELGRAAVLSRQVYELIGDFESLKNYAISMRDSRDLASITEAVQYVAAVLTQHPAYEEQVVLLDILCAGYGYTGDLQICVEYGRSSLDLKDRHHTSSIPLHLDRCRQFEFSKPERNIISFSLFGAKPRYTVFAVENAKAVRYVYPGWTCRFYLDDTVPHGVIEQLAKLGAQIVKRQRHDPQQNTGLFWRFEVASDPAVDHFLIRDVDALINVREKVAVDQWLASGKPFHILRDFFTHSELILAGLWGGVGGVLPHINQLIAQYQTDRRPLRLGQHNQDQLFLREVVWPAVKDHAFVHDSVFRFRGGVPFPEVGCIEPFRHVGQNMAVFLQSPSTSAGN